MSKTKHFPLRTCIGCRVRKKKEELIWFIWTSNGIKRVHFQQAHQGRGFYLCPDVKCLNMAKKRNKMVATLEHFDFQYPSFKGSK